MCKTEKRKSIKIIQCQVKTQFFVIFYFGKPARGDFDVDFNIPTALKGWVGHAPQGRGALHIIIIIIYYYYYLLLLFTGIENFNIFFDFYIRR